ncbi:pentatricopeptide repeat-containing protein At4g19220, mitochondrial [Lactuca sativa]|uniref:Pentacotripeptide-repeat region of PRORP domain-containing protein n=1 Tax=Lactuca sativa TaxID=4236 RepID=A0A9R1UCM4_LACSA|nr:pentatricopeptide repeat-containing protein At4g19220, mitochondrial [Lactuca sativa]KAJ0184709.1 hypothetical protein LSAT_V11C900474280 [Lactuca sativa]
MIRWASLLCKSLKTIPSSFPLNFVPFSAYKTCNNRLLLPIITSPILARLFHGPCQPFDEMPRRTQSFFAIGFFDVLNLVELCKVKPDFRNIVNVHALALKVGVLDHLPTSTSLIIAYTRAGHYPSSLALFGEVSCKDVVLWNAMMTCTIENGQFTDSISFFVQMLHQGIKFDSVTLVIAISALTTITNSLLYLQAVHSLGLKLGLLFYSDLCNALINAHAKSGDLESSESIFMDSKVKDKFSWNSMITGCLRNHHPEKSLWYFKNMVSSGTQVDDVSLSCAIAASNSLLNLHNIGKTLHGFGIKLGLDETPHVSVQNALVSLYSKCGDIDAAEILFRGIYDKDLVSWNTMIQGFASNGMILEAFHLFSEMQFIKSSIQPDTVTILSVLSLCAESMLLREGKTIHGFFIKRLPTFDLILNNSLMNMYSKCYQIDKAENLFMSIKDKDLVSWNTMISGYTQNGNSRFAQILFKKLLYQCLECSLSTVLAILSSCDSPEFLKFGESLHSWELKLGFSNNIHAINSLIFMYTNCGDLKASYKLLQSVSKVVDTACWNAMITSCTQNRYFLEALKTFNLMRQETYTKPDSVTLVSVISASGTLESVIPGKLAHGIAHKTLFDRDVRVQNVLITMYGKFGDIESASLVFDLCVDRNLCSWNCMISVLSQNKEAKTALRLFKNMDFEPDEITIATILSSCTHLGTIRYGKQIHGYILRSNFHKNSFINAALIDMYSNCGRLDISIIIFRSSSEKTIASWNSMISAYGFHSEGRKAIEVFNEMVMTKIPPTKTSFINLLSACGHSGLVEEGVGYYNCMFDEYGVERVTEHNVCVVDMLGRCGRLSEAYEFIEKMVLRDEGVLGAMLSWCSYYGDVEMGKKVGEILFDLEPQKAGYYVCLANAYVGVGSWSDAVKLRKYVEDMRLKKPGGYSLVDIGL